MAEQRYTVQLTTMVTPDMAQELNDVAWFERRSTGAVVRDALMAWACSGDGVAAIERAQDAVRRAGVQR